jgi:hypothetical protein
VWVVGRQNVRAGEKGPVASDVIPGYMPLRGDFDVEHDNDAEQVLADMEFSPQDDESERRLKLMVVEVYNRCVEEGRIGIEGAGRGGRIAGLGPLICCLGGGGLC